MMTDPIADMLTRIRNAVRIERPLVDMPHSKVKRGLAEHAGEWTGIHAGQQSADQPGRPGAAG